MNKPKQLATGLCAIGGFYAAVLFNHSSSPPVPAPAAHTKLPMYDAAVIGGGVVGLAVAQNLSARGASVIVLEKDSALAAGASSGNSGLGCTGYDAPVDSLERSLLRRSIRLHQNLYRAFGLSHDHIRKCGSLVVAWTPADLSKLPSVLAENKEAGDEDAVILSREETLSLEPALSPAALGAVFCPREAVVEPWLVPIGYAASALANGASILTSQEVVSAAFEDKAWSIETRTTQESALGRSAPGTLLTPNTPTPPALSEGASGSLIRTKTVINCAGLYGDLVERMKGPAGAFTVTPRKGQFIVFRPKTTTASPDTIIEPVATEFTKGVICWQTVWGDIVVGPTATPQTSRDDRSTDAETIASLRLKGEQMLPALKDAQVLGTYSGLRPATEHRDYQITSSKKDMWITVGGIRSTGLTASSGIGDYVGELWEELIGITAGGADLLAKDAGSAADGLVPVSEAATTPLPWNRNVNKCHRVPSLAELKEDFRKRGDGTVMVHGKVHRVTHPITSFGMSS